MHRKGSHRRGLKTFLRRSASQPLGKGILLIISCEGDRDPRWAVTTLIDEDGTYSHSGIPSGTYDLHLLYEYSYTAVGGVQSSRSSRYSVEGVWVGEGVEKHVDLRVD